MSLRTLASLPDVLPIQEELPKRPKISGLPPITTSKFGCPKLVYAIWRSGRHAIMRLSCRSWRCLECAKIKIEEMTQIFADATINIPIVQEITIDIDHLPTINKQLSRKKISALSIKYYEYAHLIMSDAIKGKGYKSEPITRAEAIVRIHKIDTVNIARKDFTRDWKPEPTYEPKKDAVIYTAAFRNTTDAEEVLAQQGINLKREILDDPLATMERLVKLRTDTVIVFDGKEYLS